MHWQAAADAELLLQIEQMNATIAGLQSAMELSNEGNESAMTHMWLIICGALVMFMHAGFNIRIVWWISRAPGKSQKEGQED